MARDRRDDNSVWAESGRNRKELQASQEATQGRKRSKGNARADSRHETGQGSDGKEAGGQTAAEVSLGPVNLI